MDKFALAYICSTFGISYDLISSYIGIIYYNLIELNPVNYIFNNDPILGMTIITFSLLLITTMYYFKYKDKGDEIEEKKNVLDWYILFFLIKGSLGIWNTSLIIYTILM